MTIFQTIFFLKHYAEGYLKSSSIYSLAEPEWGIHPG